MSLQVFFGLSKLKISETVENESRDGEGGNCSLTLIMVHQVNGGLCKK